MVTFVKATFVLATFVHIRNISGPDYDETWNILNRFQQSHWHFSRQHLFWWHLYISGISQLLLTLFWPNFKAMFLGSSLKDANCHGDICPGNICPRNICPYQEYISSNWPDFDETLKIGSWKHLEQISTVMVTFVQEIFCQATFVLVTFVHAGVSQLLLTQFWPNFKGKVNYNKTIST